MSLNHEPRAMRHFDAVVESGSYSKAAKKIHLSQPALSNSVSQLEKQLGVKLLERTAQGVKPNIYGQVLYERAKVVQAELRMVIDEIDLLRGARKGTVLIGAGPSVLEGIMLDMMLNLTNTHPNLNFSLTEGPENVLFDAVRKGELDMAICSVPLNSTSPDLEQEIFYDSLTFPIVRSGHPLTEEEQVGWPEITRFPWVIADTRLEPKDQEIMALVADQRPATIIRTNSPAFMKKMVLRSDFVTFMPKTMIQMEENNGTLTTIGDPKGIYSRPIGITTRRHSFLSPACRMVIREFRKVCEAMDLVSQP